MAGGLMALIVAVLAGGIYLAGRNDADFSNVKAQARTTEASAEISRQTADTVAAEQAGLFELARADEDFINARIRSTPTSAAPADPDVLRVAREAHARALCAASRVQREKCSDDPAATAQ